MWRRRLFLKSYAIYATVIVLIGVTILLLCSWRLERQVSDLASARLRETAGLLSRLLLSLQPETLSASQLQAELRGTSDSVALGGFRVTVIAADGTVLADSHSSLTQQVSQPSRPEILAVRSHGEGHSVRRSETLGIEMIYYALPLGAGPGAYLSVSMPVSMLQEEIALQRQPLVWAVGMGMLAALTAGWVLIRRMASPVEALTRTAETLAAENYNTRSPVSGAGDFDQLAQALNQIADNVNQRLEEASADRGHLLKVLSGMSEGVLAVDLEERVIQMNDAAAQILNALQEKVMGRPIWEVTRVREVCQALSNALHTGSDSEAELRIAAPGLDREVQMRTAPLRDAEGRLVGALLVLHDVSRLQRLERVRRDFVANVSHELKTPIAAIKGLVETLIDDQQMRPEDQHRFLGKIRNQGERLSTIVSDLLALSRLESSQGLLDREPLDMRGVVKAASQLVLSEGKDQDVQLEIQLEDAPVMVRGDVKGLTQLVNNLLDNALKHTPPNGKIVLKLAIEGAHAVLEVVDTGIGIEPQEQARIFERFYRVDKARSRAQGSTGLGLSIVKHVALVHQGSVSVESTPGKGSCFRVSIPLYRGEATCRDGQEAG